MLTPETKEELLKQLIELADLQKITSEGPWYDGHLGNEKATCNCTFITNEVYCGGIATVGVSNEIGSISEGDNDSPPKDEAVANMRFITRSRGVDFAALLEIVLHTPVTTA